MASEDRLAPPDAVELLTTSELHQTLHAGCLVRHARAVLKRSPFYREKARQAGFKLGKTGFAERFLEFPFTAKRELMEEQRVHPPYGRLMAGSRGKPQRIHLTSGSSGRPFYVALSERDVH
jgi:phenylacetate-CoA ligase